MKENKIRALLNSGEPSVSTRMWSTWPGYLESLGNIAMYDYFEFVAEYVPFTQEELANLARTSELYNMGSMIKVDFMNRGYVAQRAIAAGFQSILFSDHHTATEVRETVNMVKPEGPESEGHFGYPNARFIGMQSHIPCMEHVERLNDIVLCFMIEKQSAVNEIEEICSIKGVDMITFGANDYCITRGWNPADHKEEWRAAERHVFETALKYNVQPRAHIDSAEEMKYYLDMGVRHFCVGDQMKILKNYWFEQGIKIKKNLAYI
jgi:2-keto-3-deoxy-L-rhamnonate aldolase RhmA